MENTPEMSAPNQPASRPAQGTPGAAPGPDIAWQPVSPKYLQVRYLGWAIGSLVWAVIGFAPLVLRAAGPWRGFPLWLGIILAVFAALMILIPLFLIPRQVKAIGYAERNEDLLVKSGVIFERMVVVPYGRMQFVDVQVGPILRAFGLATVKLHTASSATNANIPGLPATEAERLREQLSARGEALLAGI